MIASRDTLSKLTQPGAPEHLPEFRLTQHNDQQELSLVCFKVRKKPNLLQNVGIEILGFVDYQNSLTTLGVVLEEPGIDTVYKELVAGIPFGIGNFQLVTQGGKQLHRRQFWIEDESNFYFIGGLLEETTTDRRLPGAYLSAEQNESPLAAQSEEKVRKGFPVPLAHIEITRIGRNREWGLFKAKIIKIHEDRK
jgi:hypothetical protein